MLKLIKRCLPWKRREEQLRVRAQALIEAMDLVFEWDWDYSKEHFRDNDYWEGLLLDPDLPIRWCNRDSLAAAYANLKQIL